MLTGKPLADAAKKAETELDQAEIHREQARVKQVLNDLRNQIKATQARIKEHSSHIVRYDADVRKLRERIALLKKGDPEGFGDNKATPDWNKAMSDWNKAVDMILKKRFGETF
jgi:predicted RNase H-like nuclease (RuvC/YqgF family)